MKTKTTKKTNILITGHPQVGKTTLIRRVVERLRGYRLSGFYSEEILERGRRQGFRLVSLGGPSRIFARRGAEVEARYRVGGYGVDSDALEAAAAGLVWDPQSPPDLLVIDEIAKMELLSGALRARILESLQGPVPVLASVALKGTGLIRKVKDLPSVVLYRVTPDNREALVGQVRRDLDRILGPKISETEAARGRKRGANGASK